MIFARIFYLFLLTFQIMLEIYLPVAKLSINLLAITFMGLLNGLFAGLFGIGGSFISIPLLILMGIPSSVCIASTGCQAMATSVGGALYQRKNGLIDFEIAIFLMIGIFLGTIFGIYFFSVAEKIGVSDIIIAFLYIFILGFIGTFMLNESVRSIYYRNKNIQKPDKNEGAFVRFITNLPPQFYFKSAGRSSSVLIPLFISFVSGVLLTFAGIGSSFLLIPIMIYAIKIPIPMAIGTSNVTGIVALLLGTIIQAIKNKNIDLFLVIILTFGAFIGLRFGMKLNRKFPPEESRFFLSLIILIVVIKMVLHLVYTPSNLFAVNFY